MTAVYTFADGYQTTISNAGGITSGATSFTPSSTAGAPTADPTASPATQFSVVLQSAAYPNGGHREVVTVTDARTGTWTCTATANAYSAGDIVAAVVSAAALAALTSLSATYAPLASPALTGAPTAPTPSGGDNSTKIATTAFVAGATYAPPTSSLILYAVGASGNVNGASLKVNWGRSGGTAPVQVGTDITLDGSDAAKVLINTTGKYTIDAIVAMNTIGGSTVGSPITGCQALLRIFGSQNSALDQIWTPYSAGGAMGAVQAVSLTQKFTAGDYLNLYGYADTLIEALSITTDGTTATVLCTGIQDKHLGMPITGTGIPASSYVGTVTRGTSFLLSSTKRPTAQANVNTTSAATSLATLGPATWALESVFTSMSIIREA